MQQSSVRSGTIPADDWDALFYPGFRAKCPSIRTGNVATFRLAQHDIEARELDFVTVVGKVEPTRLYEVMGPIGTLSNAQHELCGLFAEGLAAYRARDWDRADAAEEPAVKPPEAAAPRSGSGETVLAVEDNPALRRTVLRQLRQFGYRALQADGPAAALAVLEREKVDLLFTDIVMPGGIDGIALAKQAVERRPGLRVILTSGFPGAKVDDQLGALPDSVRLLSKPYRSSDLARLLRETLDG